MVPSPLRPSAFFCGSFPLRVLRVLRVLRGSVDPAARPARREPPAIGVVRAERDAEDGMKSCWTVLGPALALIGVLAFAAVFLLALQVNPQRGNTHRATCTSN